MTDRPMAFTSVAPRIIDYYTTGFDESARLRVNADGVLELVRTQELLRRYLPDAPARVLDVGGGPGTHARWLLADGYDVRVVDPVLLHVEQAAAIGASAELGDARELAADDATYDVVLVLGPLYHLLESDDRLRALREARRVVRPGGLVAVAAINRYASLFEHTATMLLNSERVRDSVADILRTARYEGAHGFVDAYFHTAEELVDEMRQAGLPDATVYGVEGPTWACLKATQIHTGEDLADSPLITAALQAARMAEPYPELLAASSHLLAITTS